MIMRFIVSLRFNRGITKSTGWRNLIYEIPYKDQTKGFDQITNFNISSSTIKPLTRWIDRKKWREFLYGTIFFLENFRNMLANKGKTFILISARMQVTLLRRCTFYLRYPTPVNQAPAVTELVTKSMTFYKKALRSKNNHILMWYIWKTKWLDIKKENIPYKWMQNKNTLLVVLLWREIRNCWIC